MQYKVVIIGAGPGGAVLAREIANKGVDVTIYEKGDYEKLGHGWSDAVEKIALKTVGFELPQLEGTRWVGNLVKKNGSDDRLFEPHAIPKLKLFSPGYQSVKEIEFGMITADRRNLGKTLINQAIVAGATIKYGHEGLALIYRENGPKNAGGVEVIGVRIKNLATSQEEDIMADVVVESSGFGCILRKNLPLYTGLAQPFRNDDFALVHREVRLRDKSLTANDRFPDHYRYGFNTGYQWTHVHDDDHIDVGSGVRYDPANPDPKDVIEEFISRHPSITNQRVRGGRSLCIVGPPLTNFVTNGFFVLGDAASTSVPTTGCGAGSAMLMGLWASQIVCEAAAENRKDIAKLWEINNKFCLSSDRGANFTALSGLRTVLQNLQHDDLDFLFNKDIMDAPTLQYVINGVFKPPALSAKTKSLLHGITRPGVLSRLNHATTIGTKIINHFNYYPEKWDSKEFSGWQTGINKILKSVRSWN